MAAAKSKEANQDPRRLRPKRTNLCGGYNTTETAWWVSAEDARDLATAVESGVRSRTSK